MDGATSVVEDREPPVRAPDTTAPTDDVVTLSDDTLSLACPADEDECRRMLCTAYQLGGPAAVRYPRGSGVGAALQPELVGVPFGKAEVRRRGQKIAVLAFGSMVAPALDAAQTLDATMVNMRFVKPLDTALLLELAANHEAIVTVEEGALMGGAGSAVAEALNSAGLVRPLLQLGLPDQFIDHGDPAVLLAMCGLDAAGIVNSVRSRFGQLLGRNDGPKLVVNH